MPEAKPNSLPAMLRAMADQIERDGERLWSLHRRERFVNCVGEFEQIEDRQYTGTSFLICYGVQPPGDLVNAALELLEGKFPQAVHTVFRHGQALPHVSALGQD